MTPSQAAQNLREWAERVDETGDWYFNSYNGQGVYKALADSLNVPDNEALVRLNDYSMSQFVLDPSTLPHFILWLCFLADVIETDGTDWIQNV